MRRVKFEARIKAVEMMNAYSEATSDQPGSGSNKRVSAESMLSEMGVNL